jgi:tetratricopeptide (TPR) repeat protein
MSRRISGVLAILLCVVIVASSQASTPLLQQIEQQFESGRYSDAMHVLESAISQSPQDARLHYWMARSAYEMLQFDTAINSAERACQLDPTNSGYHLWLARSLGRKAERDRSFFVARRFGHELEEAVRLAPSNIRARRDLAEFYAESPWIVGGGKGKARQQVETIVKLDPIDGILAWADYFRNTDQAGEAARQFQLLLAQKPPRADAYFEGLDFFESRRDPTQMEVFLAPAARLAPADPRLIYYRAVAHVFAGTAFAEAEKDLETYLATGPNHSDMPNHADVYERLGLLYEKKGDIKRAEEQYRAALETDSSRRRAREGLNRVTKKP